MTLRTISRAVRRFWLTQRLAGTLAEINRIEAEREQHARALAAPCIRVALTCAAHAARQEAERRTPRLPAQAPLFQEPPR